LGSSGRCVGGEHKDLRVGEAARDAEMLGAAKRPQGRRFLIDAGEYLVQWPAVEFGAGVVWSHIKAVRELAGWGKIRSFWQ